MIRQDLSNVIGKSDRQIIRYLNDIKKDHQLLERLEVPFGFPSGVKDIIPESVCDYLIHEKSSQIKGNPPKNEFKSFSKGGLSLDTTEKGVIAKEIGPERVVMTSIDTGLVNDKIISNNGKGHQLSNGHVMTDVKMNLSDRIIHGDMIAIVMTFILISADAYSCGRIAFFAFDKSWDAVAFFSLVGFAFAFASIRNAVKMPKKLEGYASERLAFEKARKIANAWLYGFGTIQLLLHAAAFKLFDISTYAKVSQATGSWILCLSIAIGTIGIGITFRKTDQS